MKKILFPATFRAHIPRQKLLLEELKKYFEVCVVEHELRGVGMAGKAINTGDYFLHRMDEIKPDLLLARADRFEILPIVMVAAYKGIPIAHLEGGDSSGAIDNRVRHAISQLADYHFCTNEDSRERLVRMGISENRIWNFGSLDVEFAKQVPPRKLRGKPYLFVAYHPIAGESEEEVTAAIQRIQELRRLAPDVKNDVDSGGEYDIVNIASNKDYGRQYGSEKYSPEDYIKLMDREACCIGKSSSFLKEASVLGTPVVNIGDRQIGRLRPKNVLDVPCKRDKIVDAVLFQSVTRYDSDHTYLKLNTAANIAKTLNEVL